MMNSRKRKTTIQFLSILFIALAYGSFGSLETYGQEKCSKPGAPMRFAFQNSTTKDIDVRLVTTNCVETPGRIIKPGEQVGGGSSANNVFRVYEAGTSRLITEVTLEASKSAYKIENCSVEGGNVFPVTIMNKMPAALEIVKVSGSCAEGERKEILPGAELKIDANAGSVFRAYSKEQKDLLSEIVIQESKTEYRLESCSKPGSERWIYIRNATAQDIEIRKVGEDCKEQPIDIVSPGRQYETNSLANNVYRAYGKGTGNFLSEFNIQPGRSAYIVNGIRNAVAQESFAETTNIIRRSKNLPEVVLDERLTSACQWFAEFMANEDQNRPGHTVKEYRKDNPFPKRNSTNQRLTYYGWDKRKTDHFEATVADTIFELDALGSHFALLWSSSNTHQKPFYSGKFKKVGFGFARAKTSKTRYYACALFAND